MGSKFSIWCWLLEEFINDYTIISLQVLKTVSWKNVHEKMYMKLLYWLLLTFLLTIVQDKRKYCQKKFQTLQFLTQKFKRGKSFPLEEVHWIALLRKPSSLAEEKCPPKFSKFPHFSKISNLLSFLDMGVEQLITN